MKTFSTKLLLALITAACTMLVGNAHASTITLSTGFSGSGPLGTAAEYKSTVDAAIAIPTSGYGTTSLAVFDNVSNQAFFGSNSDIAYKYNVDFDVTASDAGLWHFRAGVDFGSGGAVFIDGVAIDTKSYDIWWNGAYSDPSQYFLFSAALGSGMHTLSIYGIEGCCDGASQAQFRAAGAETFTTFSTTDGATVPEPATLALFGLGLLGFGLGRKRKV